MKAQKQEALAAMRDVTQRMLQAFMVLHRTARTHALNNEALVAPMQGVVDVVNSLFELTGACEFLLSGTVCVANGTITVPELSQLEMVREVAAELRAKNVGGFRVFGQATPERIRGLMAALVAGAIGVPASGEFEVLASGPIEATLRELHRNEVESITRRDPAERAVALYGALITVVQRTVEAARTGRQSGKAFSTSRVMRELIEGGQSAPHVLLALALQRDERLPYLLRHLANTTILSILVGLELKQSRGDLLHLANVALMHEAGVAAYGEHLERAGKDLSPEDRQLVKDLPLLSARMFLRRRGLDHESLRNVLASVECKRPYDDPVSASTSGSQRTMMGARIVQACSTFDALTSNRPFRAALAIPVALQKIEAGQPKVDPRVMHALVAVLAEPRRLIARPRAAAPAPRPRAPAPAPT
jgi:HD-GYP domain-containing protein (c-di-GMP phosphodiesterase class II)